jgi:hypothetical protein
MAVAWKKLAYEEDVVLKTTLATAHSVMVANEVNTPTELTVAASRIVGRASTGNIAALQKSDVLTLLNVEDGADVTDATNVASAGAVMESDFTAKGDIIIGTGVGTAAVLGAGSNGQILTLDSEEATGVKWAAAAGTGDLKADGSVPMTADFDFAGYAAKDVKIHTVANNTALLELTPVVGKLAFQTDTLAAYICTSAV